MIQAMAGRQDGDTPSPPPAIIQCYRCTYASSGYNVIKKQTYCFKVLHNQVEPILALSLVAPSLHCLYACTRARWWISRDRRTSIADALGPDSMLTSYHGYLPEPHWNTVELPEISRTAQTGMRRHRTNQSLVASHRRQVQLIKDIYIEGSGQDPL